MTEPLELRLRTDEEKQFRITDNDEFTLYSSPVRITHSHDILRVAYQFGLKVREIHPGHPVRLYDNSPYVVDGNTIPPKTIMRSFFQGYTGTRG